MQLTDRCKLLKQVTTRLSARSWLAPVPDLIHLEVEVRGIESGASWLVDRHADPCSDCIYKTGEVFPQFNR